jgi:uncharacterized cupredoxin-like copper-binding protein
MADRAATAAGDRQEGVERMMKALIGVLLVLTACAQSQQRQEPSQQQEPAGPREVTVTAVEYEFQGMPRALPAGETAIVLENAGEQPHQMSIARITTDATVEELLELPEKEADQQIEDVGNLFTRPGGSEQRVIDLTAGRYGFVCFVTTKESGGPHAFKGMYGEFTVS